MSAILVFDFKKLNGKKLEIHVDEVVSSWKYEYQVFELVRILKTINYDKNLVVLTGW